MALVKLFSAFFPGVKQMTADFLNYKIGGTALTASAAELNLLDTSVAGTAVASKALVLGANKNVDVLAVADLKLGAGAGTSVSATAAQLNRAAVETAGTVEASKVVVVDANKQVNEWGLSTAAYMKGLKFQVSIPSAAAATVGMPLWTAPAACEIISMTERHITVCDAADTMTLEKVPSGTAAGSGTVVLVGNFTLNSTANTDVTVNCHGTAATRQLAAGDTLHAKFASGDGTNYAGAVWNVQMKWI